jgi:hypothetical protein
MRRVHAYKQRAIQQAHGITGIIFPELSAYYYESSQREQERGTWQGSAKRVRENSESHSLTLYGHWIN